MKALSCFGCRGTPASIFQGVSFHYYTIGGTWERQGPRHRVRRPTSTTDDGQAARHDELIRAATPR